MIQKHCHGNLYKITVKEMKKKLPHDDDLLNNLQRLEPYKQGKDVMRSKFMTMAKQFLDAVSKEDLSKVDFELKNYDTYEVPDVIDRTGGVKYLIDVGKLNDTVNYYGKILIRHTVFWLSCL